MRQDVTFHNGQTGHRERRVAQHPARCRPRRRRCRPAASSRRSSTSSPARWSTRPTLEIVLNTPYAILDSLLAEYTLGIIPGGDFDPHNPVGTGPFKYESFQAGKTSTFKKYADYWGDAAFLDELRDPGLHRRQREGQRAPGRPDPDGRQPALQPGRHDQGRGRRRADRGGRPVGAVHDARRPGAVRRRQGAPGDAADRRPPGDDRPDPERLRLAGQRPVRPARRRLRQRPAAARAGHRPGQVAARRGGPGRASRSSCSPATTSARWPRPAANLFAEQAKEAGVEVKVTKKTPFYDDDYLSYTFAQDFWNTRNYIPQAVVGTFPPEQGGTYNETHWDNQEHRDLVNAAAKELDEAKRTDLLHQAQEIEYNEGGLIIWGFRQQVDGVRRQRAGARTEQVPPARQLQVQQGLGLTMTTASRPSRIRSRRSRLRGVAPAGRPGPCGSRAASDWRCSVSGWSRSWSSSRPPPSATRCGRSSAATTTPTSPAASSSRPSSASTTRSSRRYFDWLGGLFTGDFGTSLANQQPVWRADLEQRGQHPGAGAARRAGDDPAGVRHRDDLGALPAQAAGHRDPDDPARARRACPSS